MAGAPDSRVRRLMGDLHTIATMPRVRIVLSRGTPEEDEVLRRFRRRHPRYRVVGSKTLGVALLPLDDLAGTDDYLTGRRYLRRRVRRAERLGYTVAGFDPEERRADLLAIHASLPERQGRPIDADYLDPDAVVKQGPNVEYLGVLRDGTVVAYTRLDHVGEIAGMGRVMGHGDHLEAGVMYLLMAGIVGHVKAARPQARWIFYDMFFGAPDGLRAFKRNAGFEPHLVRWRREAPGGALSRARRRA
jgi:hypothetical protein